MKGTTLWGNEDPEEFPSETLDLDESLIFYVREKTQANISSFRLSRSRFSNLGIQLQDNTVVRRERGVFG